MDLAGDAGDLFSIVQYHKPLILAGQVLKVEAMPLWHHRPCLIKMVDEW